MPNSNVDFIAQAHDLFLRAPFVRDLGMALTAVTRGDCTAEVTLTPRHLQQDGFAHAGVLATLADHTAGAAAMTMAPPNCSVLSVDFTVHLLRPAVGAALQCRSRVLRHGRTLSVVESEVMCAGKLVAKATVTLAVVAAERLPQRPAPAGETP